MGRPLVRLPLLLSQPLSRPQRPCSALINHRPILQVALPPRSPLVLVEVEVPLQMSRTSNFSCLVRPIQLLPQHALSHRPRTATMNLEWKRVPPGNCNRMEMASLQNRDQPWADFRLLPITRILTLGHPCLEAGRIQQLVLHRLPHSPSGVPPSQIHLHRKILSQKNQKVLQVSAKPLLLPLLYPPHSALVNN